MDSALQRLFIWRVCSFGGWPLLHAAYPGKFAVALACSILRAGVSSALVPQMAFKSSIFWDPLSCRLLAALLTMIEATLYLLFGSWFCRPCKHLVAFQTEYLFIVRGTLNSKSALFWRVETIALFLRSRLVLSSQLLLSRPLSAVWWSSSSS